MRRRPRSDDREHDESRHRNLVRHRRPSDHPRHRPRRPPCPAGTGRPRVLRIISSMSRSKYMFIAFAPPATTEPPHTVANMSHSDGMPPPARIIAGIVVMTSNITMRGFVSRTYAHIVSEKSRAIRVVVALVFALSMLCGHAGPFLRDE